MASVHEGGEMAVKLRDVSCMEGEGLLQEEARPEKRQRKLPASLAPSLVSDVSTSQGRQCNLARTARALQFKGIVQIAKTESECVWLASKLLLDKPAAVGFDVEWRVSYETGFPPRKISLIQVCYRTNGQSFSPDGSDCVCLLFQLFHCGVHKVLRSWLQGSVVKAGANIGGDACKLKVDYDIDLKNTVELGAMAKEKGGGDMISSLYRKGFGLSDMLNEVTGGEMMLNKPNNIRTGDWEALNLSPDQVKYAATDAFASLVVYEALSKQCSH